MSAPIRLGNYELLMELASGGMGVLYVARRAGAAGFERLVVVKRVHDRLSFDPAFRKMLRDEARLMSFVHDAHVASVLDVIEGDGRLSLVLEYVESISLAALVSNAKSRGERIPIPIVARIASDVLAGLHAAHEARGATGEPLGLIHRDVSPQNVIVGLDGTARLIDFGIAKATMQPASGATETQSGILKGKLRYMSPEQVKQVALDRRTDVFSAGVVLYEALTGERMFRNEDDADLLLSLLLGDVRPPRDWVAEISEALEAVVMRAVERDREERFPTAAAFGEALENATTLASTRDVARYVEAHGGAELATRRERLRERAREANEANVAARTRRRRITVLAFGATALAGVIAFGAVRSLHAKPLPAPALEPASAQPAATPSSLDTIAAPLPSAESPAKTGSAHTASTHAPAHPTTHVPPPSRCSPPYDILPDGTHRFKPECVR